MKIGNADSKRRKNSEEKKKKKEKNLTNSLENRFETRRRTERVPVSRRIKENLLRSVETIVGRQAALRTIVLTCLNRETVTRVREFVRGGERANFYSVRGSRFQRAVAVSDLVVAILAADREILHGPVFERIIRLHHLKVDRLIRSSI